MVALASNDYYSSDAAMEADLPLAAGDPLQDILDLSVSLDMDLHLDLQSSDEMDLLAARCELFDGQ